MYLEENEKIYEDGMDSYILFGKEVILLWELKALIS